ncbi:MAG: histidine phosphatase family protein [Propioniciclava sp.]
MRLHLIRHGRTRSNVERLLDTAAPGADLDEAGRDQAVSLVERLNGSAITALYASDRVRTQQTAAPLASAHGIEVAILPGLGEILAGAEEMSPEWQGYIDMLVAWGEGDLTASMESGEDAHAFLTRFDAAIDAIVAAGDAAAAAVSHGAALRTWVTARVRGIEPTKWGPGSLGNTAVLTIDGDPDSGWDLVSWDQGVEA